MKKKILITGATSGIGFEAAKLLAAGGHHLLVHGRSAAKLADLERALANVPGVGVVETYEADLTSMADVEALAAAVRDKHDTLDVLINNAGVFKMKEPVTPAGDDLRFVVNTLAPYLLTQRLLPVMGASGRVINLSSAAQNPVDLAALEGGVVLSDFEAYAQSKLALTMWSGHLGRRGGDDQPVFIAVNPGSMLGTEMVKQAFGVAGNDIAIGARILAWLAQEEELEADSGAYFDNDAGRFASPHPDALDPQKSEVVVRAIEAALTALRGAP